MSNDGQNFEHPVNPSDDTQPQPAVNVADDVAGQQSRRKFLRTAVISGVAVATVGTTAGVAAAAANPHPGVLKRLGINLGTVSGQHVCTMCFENTGFGQINNTFTVDKNGHASPGDFYLWFTAQNLASGTYTISISPDPGVAPFTYSGNANQCKLYQLPVNTATQCPSALPTTAVKTKFATSVSGLGAFTTTGSGNADLQLAVHMKWVDGTKISGPQTYTFTATLSNGSGTVCTASITVTATPKK
jgi:hypothetical protein